jgi:hypothetical protein
MAETVVVRSIVFFFGIFGLKRPARMDLQGQSKWIRACGAREKCNGKSILQQFGTISFKELNRSNLPPRC